MNSTTVLTLQVLLILLPLVAVMGPDSDNDGTGQEGDFDVRRLECEHSDSKIDIPVKMGEKMRKMAKTGTKKRHVMCYENIELKMTKECSPFQAIDFSNMKVHDFCVGGYVHLGGSITLFSTIRRPFSISTNITKVSQDSENESVVPQFSGGVANIHVLEVDGCKLFEIFFCSTSRSAWCGCPFPWGKAPLFSAKMHVTADFMPKRFGTGKFIGKSEFEFPAGRACLEFTFDRVKI